ncbi:MAG: hypothetical protein ACTSVC_05440 [Promethearchaeota archaeon]
MEITVSIRATSSNSLGFTIPREIQKLLNIKNQDIIRIRIKRVLGRRRDDEVDVPFIKSVSISSRCLVVVIQKEIINFLRLRQGSLLVVEIEKVDSGDGSQGTETGSQEDSEDI